MLEIILPVVLGTVTLLLALCIYVILSHRPSLDWDKIPEVLGLIKLALLRKNLFDHNLYSSVPKVNGQYSSEGHRRFGRNVPHSVVKTPTDEEIYRPLPAAISDHLLARKGGKIIPATGLNYLAASWIQFNVHDWMNHFNDTDKFKNDKTPAGHLKVRENGADVGGPPGPMLAPRSLRAKPLPGDEVFKGCPIYENRCTPEWDASVIYGSSPEEAKALRTFQKGQLRMDQHNLLPLLGDESKQDDSKTPGYASHIAKTGFAENWWVGLEMLQWLFAAEHNVVAEMLSKHHPDWSDERLFMTARYIVAAEIAKIHTVEWTTSLLGSKILHDAMNANWDGLCPCLNKCCCPRGWAGALLSGIRGGTLTTPDVPYFLTEEFTAVYRMHQLVRDVIPIPPYIEPANNSGAKLKSVVTVSPQSQGAAAAADDGTDMLTLEQCLFGHSRSIVEKYGMPRLFQAFGTCNPGALVLHNFPNMLRRLPTENGSGPILDLAAIDIIRDRERGILKYNAFRRLTYLPPAQNWDWFDVDAETRKTMREIYEDDLEKVDLLIGCLAEPRPEFHAFGNTAFYIFIVMASRRLSSDPMFTTKYNAETYTREGLEWIEDCSFAAILERHIPGTAAAIGGGSPFAPWKIRPPFVDK